MARILVVEDERIVAFGLERSLGKLGYEVTGDGDEQRAGAAPGRGQAGPIWC